jgi:DNA processing protein
MSVDVDLESAVALAEARPPGDTRLAAALWEAVWHGPAAAAVSVLPIDGIAAALGCLPHAVSDMVDAARPRARESIARAARAGLTCVPWYHAQYPARLTAIADPPIVLWMRGSAGTLDALADPTIAIVGSRRATPTGLAIARRLAGDIADAGFTVVSGMARGIDGAAHAGALDRGARTVAVLGCGADVIYPREHAALAGRILESGGIVSELSPGTPPLPPHFPLRNRIISGLALAVVIVEASDKSGSLITARMALEQGRDVLAVPGSVLSGQYRGSHALIKDGARLVETVDDVLQEIGWFDQNGGTKRGPRVPHPSPLESLMAPAEPYSLDDLAARTTRSTADLLAELGSLEIRGRIVRTPAGQFVRLDERASDREEHGQGTRRRRIAVKGEDDQQISGA